MTSLEQNLKQLGLDEKEASVYVSALQLGTDTAYNIARHAGMKRSTVYVKLGELNLRGLVEISQTKKATIYRAVSPRRLVQEIEFRKNQAEEILPTLLALYKSDPGKPRIQILEGERAMEETYEDIIHAIKNKEEVVAFGSLAHCQGKNDYYLNEWAKTMKDHRFRTKELLDGGSFEQKYIQNVHRNKNPKHEIRTVPEGTFTNDNIIYGNRLAIFSTDKSLYVTIIEEKNIVNTYRNFFNLAWQSARLP